jgi:preprotein translocase subunit YajC
MLIGGLPQATSSGGSPYTSLLIFLLPVALIVFMVWSQRRRQRATQ